MAICIAPQHIFQVIQKVTKFHQREDAQAELVMCESAWEGSAPGLSLEARKLTGSVGSVSEPWLSMQGTSPKQLHDTAFGALQLTWDSFTKQLPFTKQLLSARG